MDTEKKVEEKKKYLVKAEYGGHKVGETVELTETEAKEGVESGKLQAEGDNGPETHA